MKKNTIIALIQESFRKAKYPGDNNLVYSNDPQHLECAEVKTFLKNIKWEDVTAEDALRQNSALCFMTPEAIHYYLPAYMLLCVTNYNDVDVVSSNVVCEIGAYSETVFRGFNKEQLQAILNFLKYLEESHRPDFGGELSEAILRVEHALRETN